MSLYLQYHTSQISAQSCAHTAFDDHPQQMDLNGQGQPSGKASPGYIERTTYRSLTRSGVAGVFAAAAVSASSAKALYLTTELSLRQYLQGLGVVWNNTGVVVHQITFAPVCASRSQIDARLAV